MVGKSVLLNSKYTDIVACFSIFASCIFLGWLLSLAYPDGITNYETPPYWYATRYFSLFKPGLDWWRTPAYGWILQVLSIFDHPSIANYWFNLFTFSVDSALVYLLARLLFSSSKSAWILAFSLLLFEFASMRFFFFNVYLMADPPYAALAYMGVLLMLIGWISENRIAMISGYSICGLASFIKPVGSVLVLMALCFAAFVWWDRRTKGKNIAATLLISVCLLLAPMTMWCLRNYFVYGFAKNSDPGYSLLKATLPLLSDNDNVLGDKVSNAEFIATVRATLVSRFGDHLESISPAHQRDFWHEQYFFKSQPVLGPFDYLAGLRRFDLQERKNIHSDSARMFALDNRCMGVGLKIICAHPLGYLQRVLGEYHAMFDTTTLTYNNLEYQIDPKNIVPLYLGCLPEANAAIYRGSGKPDFHSSNASVSRAIANIRSSPILLFILNLYYANEFWLCHLIFFGACLTYALLRLNRRRIVNYQEWEPKAVVLIFLFLNAASYSLLVALIESPMQRLAIGGGDLFLHLMFFIAILAIIGASARVQKSLSI